MAFGNDQAARQIPTGRIIKLIGTLDIILPSLYFTIMQKTQVQIPDELFGKVKALAARKEVSFAELVRRGLEYVVRVYPEPCTDAQDWSPPKLDEVEVNWDAVGSADLRDLLEEESVENHLAIGGGQR